MYRSVMRSTVRDPFQRLEAGYDEALLARCSDDVVHSFAGTIRWEVRDRHADRVPPLLDTQRVGNHRGHGSKRGNHTVVRQRRSGSAPRRRCRDEPPGAAMTVESRL